MNNDSKSETAKSVKGVTIADKKTKISSLINKGETETEYAALSDFLKSQLNKEKREKS